MKNFKVIQLGYGFSSHIQRLSQILSDRGNEVYVITADKFGPFPQNTKVQYLTYSSKDSIFRKIRTIRQLIRKINPDILHSHFVNYGGYLGLFSFFHPHVVSAWGCDVLNVPRESLIHKILVSLTLRSADHLLPVSNEIKNRIDEMIGVTEKNTVFSWGVDTQLFSPDKSGQSFREKYKIAPEAFFILSPRGIQPIYNHHLILIAFKEILKKYPESILGMPGFGADENYNKTLKKQIQELDLSNKVLLFETLDINELPNRYNAADLILSLANSDGTPLTVLEAMSCGRIVVGTAIDTIRDWIMDGKNGFLCDISTPEKTVSKLVEVISKIKEMPKNELTEIGVAARQMVSENADREKNTSDLLKLYGKILEKKDRFKHDN